MAITKNAMIRYQTLDRCFKNKFKRYTVTELLREVNDALFEFNGTNSSIQKRQLYDDIRFMESDQGWSIPLERIREGRNILMSYYDSDFSIRKQPLNDDEKSKLRTALEVLSRFSGAPQFEWVQETLPILRDKLQLSSKHRDFIKLDSNPDLKGITYLPVLYEAIEKQQVLSIDYKHFKASDSEEITFHPYFLKEYNKRWFVFGRNEEITQSNWNLALDRINKINYSNHQYFPDETDWDDYFFDIVGVTKPSNRPKELIELDLEKSIVPYILTKPLHPSQKVQSYGNQTKITINVIPNFELTALILSYCPFVTVLKPDYLKAEITELLKTSLKNYDSLR